MTLTIGSLFAGIGGLELGLEWAGLGPVLWQVEIDPFCRSVLAKHWPNVTRFEDVTTVRHFPHVDVVCGGFPCQDVSSAGKRRGLGGQRSGLWYWFASVVDQVRPLVVIVENVASGASRWLPTVRQGLHLLGYDSTAYALSAADVGAPHLRRRVFVVAHADRQHVRQQPRRSRGASGQGPLLAAWVGATRDAVANADSERRTERQRSVAVGAEHTGTAGAGDVRLLGHSHRDRHPVVAVDGEVAGLRTLAGDAPRWPALPDLRRVDDELPNRLDRLRALGNAVVPACAEVIGRIVAETLGGAS